jgi:choline dehydrogenase-like flavoprotein
MEMRYDAVIIGSGAAGSVMAYQLANKGMRVLVVERGARHDPTTFEHNELAMFPRLYKQGGLQTTTDHDVTIAQGQAVGGSTVINNAIWLRADLDRVLPSWAQAGAPVPREYIEKAYAELEWALHVNPIPALVANKGTNVFLQGAAALGIRAGYLNNNRRACLGCGWCNYGCRYNRKTSMLVTFIPWAEACGATVLDNCLDARVVMNGNTAAGVRFRRDGQEIFARAERVVVCAGAIGSSQVLLQSGITNDGRVGKGLHALGGLVLSAETEEVQDGFDGIGLTAVAHASDEYVIESYFAPPVVFSLALGGWFLTHFRRMQRYKYYVQAGVMCGTHPTGTVKLDKKGRAQINLAFDQQDLGRLKAGMKTLASIFFAGGATRVIPATFKLVECSRVEDIDQFDERIRRPDDLLIGTAHPQGGNAMSEDPRGGVVGPDFAVHGARNLFVADASVFPTNIWANCQATVMAMSHYAAGFVAR